MNSKYALKFKQYFFPYLDLHASNRFAQLEHDKDQVWVYCLSATGAGLLSTEDIKQSFNRLITT